MALNRYISGNVGMNAVLTDIFYNLWKLFSSWSRLLISCRFSARASQLTIAVFIYIILQFKVPRGMENLCSTIDFPSFVRCLWWTCLSKGFLQCWDIGLKVGPKRHQTIICQGGGTIRIDNNVKTALSWRCTFWSILDNKETYKWVSLAKDG